MGIEQFPSGHQLQTYLTQGLHCWWCLLGKYSGLWQYAHKCRTCLLFNHQGTTSSFPVTHHGIELSSGWDTREVYHTTRKYPNCNFLSQNSNFHTNTSSSASSWTPNPDSLGIHEVTRFGCSDPKFTEYLIIVEEDQRKWLVFIITSSSPQCLKNHVQKHSMTAKDFLILRRLVFLMGLLLFL